MEKATVEFPIGQRQPWLLEAPNRRDVLALFAVAVLARVALLVFSLALTHRSLEQFTAYADGPHYLRYTQLILGQVESILAFDQRLFPLTPAAMALLNLIGIPLHATGAVLSIVAGSVAAAASAMLFRSRIVGLAMVFLPPENMSLLFPNMESPMLALLLVGLILATRGRYCSAGLTLGLAGAGKVTAAFGVIGIMVALIANRQVRQAFTIGVLALLVVLASLGAVWYWLGNPLAGVAVYTNERSWEASRLLDWPLRQTVLVPFYIKVSAAKILSVWTHAILIVGALGLLVWQLRGQWRSTLHVLAFLWLLGNTLLVTSIGGAWAFHALPRYSIAAMPPLLWAYRRWIPRHWLAWTGMALASMASVLVLNRHRYTQ